MSVKDELTRGDSATPSARLAELTTIFRFGGGLHLIGGQLAIEVELDHEPTAARVRHAIHTLFGINSGAQTAPPNANRKFPTYRIQVQRGADQLALHTGLLDARRRPVRGLPHKITTAPVADLVGVLRGHSLLGASCLTLVAAKPSRLLHLLMRQQWHLSEPAPDAE